MAMTSSSGNDLTRRVSNSLESLGYAQLRNVRVEEDRGTVRLRGAMGSFYLKQVAQSIAAKVPGVHRVVNEIEVSDAPTRR